MRRFRKIKIGDLSARQQVELRSAINILHEEYIESVRNIGGSMLKEGLSTFIPPNIVQNNGAESRPIYSLFESFIGSENARSLLVLGDSGAGKTTVMYKLAEYLWGKYDDDNPDKCAIFRVPVYISLRKEKRIINDPDFIIRCLMKKSINPSSIDLLRQCGLLLLLCDGFDEVVLKSNWFLNNECIGEPLKIVTTCRPEVLRDGVHKNTYDLLAVPGMSESLIEWRLQPFTDNQVRGYLRAYFRGKLSEVEECAPAGDELERRREEIRRGKEEASESGSEDMSSDEDKASLGGAEKSVFQECEDLINQLGNLRSLVKTPVILYMVMSCLPEMLKHKNSSGSEGEGIETNEVYKIFTERWFYNQSERVKHLASERMPNLSLPLDRYMRIYCENIAEKCLRTTSKGEPLSLLVSKEQSIDGGLLFPKFRRREDGYNRQDYYEYFRHDHLSHELDELRNKFEYDLTVDDEMRMSSLESLIKERVQNVMLIRSGCPLSSEGDGFIFIHKSLIEFFTSQALYQCVDSIDKVLVEYVSNDCASGDKLFNKGVGMDFKENDVFFRKRVRDHPNVVAFLARRVICNDVYERSLKQLIEYSKEFEYFSIAAGNAATILVCSGVSLINSDWSHVNLSGADFRKGVLSGVNFSRSNLVDCLFDKAFLAFSNFNFSNISGSKWSLETRLPLSRKSKCVSLLYSRAGGALACGDSVGNIHMIDMESSRVLFILKNYKKTDFLSSPVNCMSFSPVAQDEVDSAYLAAAYRNEIWLWELSSRGKFVIGRHTSKITALEWSPWDGSLVSGATNGDIKLWSNEGGHEWQEVICVAHPNRDILLAWSRVNRRFISIDSQGCLGIWDMQKLDDWAENELRPAFDFNVYSLCNVSFSPRRDVFGIVVNLCLYLYSLESREATFIVSLSTGWNFVRGASVFGWSKFGDRLLVTCFKDNGQDIALYNVGLDFSFSLNGYIKGLGSIFCLSPRDDCIASPLNGVLMIRGVYIDHRFVIEGGKRSRYGGRGEVYYFSISSSGAYISIFDNDHVEIWCKTDFFGDNSYPLMRFFVTKHPFSFYRFSDEDLIQWSPSDEYLIVFNSGYFSIYFLDLDARVASRCEVRFMHGGDLESVSNVTSSRDSDDSGAVLSDSYSELVTVKSVMWRENSDQFVVMFEYRFEVFGAVDIMKFERLVLGDLSNILDKNTFSKYFLASSLQACVVVDGNNLVLYGSYSGVIDASVVLKSFDTARLCETNDIFRERNPALAVRGVVYSRDNSVVVVFGFYDVNIILFNESRACSGHQKISFVHCCEPALSPDGKIMVIVCPLDFFVYRFDGRSLFEEIFKFSSAERYVSARLVCSHSFFIIDGLGRVSEYFLESNGGLSIRNTTARHSSFLDLQGCSFLGSYIVGGEESASTVSLLSNYFSSFGALVSLHDPVEQVPLGIFITKGPPEEFSNNIVQGLARLSRSSSSVSILNNKHNHAFLLIEFISSFGHQVIRAEIVKPAGSKYACLIHRPWEDDSMFSKLRSMVKGWGCRVFQISPDQCQALMDDLFEDNFRKIRYSLFGWVGYNCLTWCYEKLENIGISVSNSDDWLDAVILSPNRHLPLPDIDEPSSSSFQH